MKKYQKVDSVEYWIESRVHKTIRNKLKYKQNTK